MRFSCLALVLACAGAPPKPTPADPFADLNRAARAAYAEARTRALGNAEPVLIVGPAHITLLRGASRDEFELVPPLYQDLKSIAHLALGLHAIFFEAQGDPAGLAGLRAAASRALEGLRDRGFTSAQVDRQREIIRLSLAVEGVRDLPAYERTVAPLLLANALDAASAEIADLDAAVAAARRAMTPQGFSRLQVIVVGGHMAREGEIAMQYFEKLLGEREGLRLVFAEGLWDERSELQLLATHRLDASVAKGFFADPRRMHRDLLSDAAAQLLATRP
jgi:hypothetical protein